MGGQGLHDMGNFADLYWVRTQGKYSLIANALSDRLFICSELLPILFAPEPEGIPGNTHTSKPFSLSMLGFRHPVTKNKFSVKSARGKIPLTVRKNFQVFIHQVLVRIGQDLLQGLKRVVFGNGISSDPHAEFVVLQAGLDIWHRQFEQLVLGVKEGTDVFPPPGSTDARYPHTPLFHASHLTRGREIVYQRPPTSENLIVRPVRG